MKSLRELQAIKNKMKASVNTRDSVEGKMRILVGMATCGIAAGARPVLNAFVEQLSELGLAQKVTVSQTGCVGLCQYEPIVEIHEAGKEKVTYVKMTAEKAKEVAEKHLKGGNVVAEYTVANCK